jgi:hypothetical protein
LILRITYRYRTLPGSLASAVPEISVTLLGSLTL